MNTLNQIRIEALSKFTDSSRVKARLEKTLTGLKSINETGGLNEGGAFDKDDDWQATLLEYKETVRLAELIAKQMGYQTARPHYINAIELADKLLAQSKSDWAWLERSIKVLSTGVLSDGTPLTEEYESILGNILLKGQRFFEAAGMFHSAEKFEDEVDASLLATEIALLENCSKRATTKPWLAMAYRKAIERISPERSKYDQDSPLSTTAWLNFRRKSNSVTAHSITTTHQAN